MENGGLLSNLWNKGELPSIKTEVTLDKASLDYLAIVLVIVILIGVAFSAIAKRI